MNKMDIYYNSPVFLQNLLISIGKSLENKKNYKYQKTADKELEQTEKMTLSQLKGKQFNEFKKLLEYAYNNIPFYRELYIKNNLDINEIKSLDDIEKVPFITKKDIRDNFTKMRNSSYKTNEQINSHTSGTTGTPLQFITDAMTESYYNAQVKRHRRWNGYEYNGYCASFGGKKIISNDSENKILWRWSIPDKLLIFSSFHLTDENILRYLKVMKKNNIRFIKGYSSNLYIIAMSMAKNQIKMPLEGVFFGSEPMYDYQKKKIEEVFDCQVSNFYGNSERTAFAYDCKMKNGLHIAMENTLIQICDENGKEKKNGEAGEIIGTNLLNYSMPLIRYKTGDVSRKLDRRCKCGVEHELIEEIETKIEDYIIGLNNEKISPSALTHPFKTIKMNVIENSQIIQATKGVITIRLVKGLEFESNQIEKLKKEFKERFKNNLEIEIEYVDTILSLNNGKYKWVVSKISD
jgi:phenylacetate-CoA ligase